MIRPYFIAHRENPFRFLTFVDHYGNRHGDSLPFCLSSIAGRIIFGLSAIVGEIIFGVLEEGEVRFDLLF